MADTVCMFVGCGVLALVGLWVWWCALETALKLLRVHRAFVLFLFERERLRYGKRGHQPKLALPGEILPPPGRGTTVVG